MTQLTLTLIWKKLPLLKDDVVVVQRFGRWALLPMAVPVGLIASFVRRVVVPCISLCLTLAVSSRNILQSFVSSHTSDVFKCHSRTVDSFLTPPYACAYSNGMSVPFEFIFRTKFSSRSEKCWCSPSCSCHRARIRPYHRYNQTERMGLW